MHDELQSFFKAIWPVGSIYTTTSAGFDPNSYFGGTWIAFGAGRVLVGQDAGQAEFDVIEETGGEKTHVLTTQEMPSHTHVQNAHTHIQDPHTHVQNAHSHTEQVQGGTTASTTGTHIMASAATGGSLRNAGQSTVTATAVNQNATATNQNATAVNQNTGGGEAHNNLQPYIVVKMWKRVS
jgi:microcystin-dependent protein